MTTQPQRAPSISESIIIDAPCPAVFDLLHDYSQRLAWDPFLRRACVIGGSAVDVGTRTWCAAKARSGWLGMGTVYITFARPHVAAVRMTRGPWFLRTFAASMRQQPTADGHTELTYRFSFGVRPRWAARLLNLIFGRVFRHETQRRLRALKAYMERA